MGTFWGPNISEVGLVFGYDTSESTRFFNGKPGTNILPFYNLRWMGTNNGYFSNGKLFESEGLIETSHIPTLGNREVKSMKIYNVYSGYGVDGNFNCCPSLFGYGDGIPVVGNTEYIYQIIYRCDSDYTHPNFMYHYEFGPSGYITEYGVFDNTKRKYLGNGWWHAWNTFTTNVNATTISCGMWYYQYNVIDKVSLAGASVSLGNSVRQPKQILEPAETLLTTNSILELTKTNVIDVSNVSFNSIGQPTFDGTNDYINLVDFNIFNGSLSFSVELIFNITAFNGACVPISFFGENLLMYTFGDGLPTEVLGFRGYINNTWVTPVYTPVLTTNKYYHVITTYSPVSGFNLYLNGINVSSNSLVGTVTTYPAQNSIGSLGNNTRFFNGSIPVLRIYSRQLSLLEGQQNYNAYKNRFNI